ncbi:MAG: dipicolinate synthase subunit DpsA [Clostridia bacterium]|nr:dipicolinate synthase subunit DpsA [Clostridia bacterium]
MKCKLEGIKIAVLGGDDRELTLIPRLVALGAKVKVAGFPLLPELSGTTVMTSLEATVNEIDVIILPMPGTDQHGNIRAIYADEKLVMTESVFKQIPQGTPIIVGVAKKFLKDLANKYKVKLLEIAEIDEVAILNAIPTAEGAIQLAMEQTDFTIHNSTAHVLGFGRVGFTMARVLAALGAKVTIVVRKKADVARGFELGYHVCNYQEISEEIGKADLIFNTVPAMVLPKDLLAKIKKRALIIDLASQPGGTDFPAAEKLGIKAILAPGLPGKVAPKTAGEILAKVIPGLILENLQ